MGDWADLLGVAFAHVAIAELSGVPRRVLLETWRPADGRLWVRRVRPGEYHDPGDEQPSERA